MPERTPEECTGRTGTATDRPAQTEAALSTPADLAPAPDLSSLVQLIAKAIVLQIDTEDKAE